MARHVRVAGHFGELMQGRIGCDGPVALISLPCPSLAVEGWHVPGPGLSIHGAGQRLMTPERARKFLFRLESVLSGRILLRAGMPAGGGAGASTATLVALARIAGAKVAPAALARACVAAEGASDPLMFPNPGRILWASRRGEVLADMPPFPRLDIIGGFFGPHRRTDARDMDFPDIADLVDAWRQAGGDAATCAALASESARRTLALRGPEADPTEALATELGALGFAIAHTGSARALLFRPGTRPDKARERLRRAHFREIVSFSVGGHG